MIRAQTGNKTNWPSGDLRHNPVPASTGIGDQIQTGLPLIGTAKILGKRKGHRATGCFGNFYKQRHLLLRGLRLGASQVANDTGGNRLKNASTSSFHGSCHGHEFRSFGERARDRFT